MTIEPARPHPISRLVMRLLEVDVVEGTQHGSLSMADRERLLRLCSTAHRMGRRTLGIGQNRSSR